MFTKAQFQRVNRAKMYIGWLIKLYFHCRLILLVCHVYIVILYVLYDDVCMYNFCSVLIYMYQYYRSRARVILNVNIDLRKHTMCGYLQFVRI